MPPSCPSCGKPLVSRQSPLCSHCGAKIPAALLFSAEERNQIAAEEQRAKERLEQLEAENEQKAKAARAQKRGFRRF